jgi:hypothetical protein
MKGPLFTKHGEYTVQKAGNDEKIFTEQDPEFPVSGPGQGTDIGA